MPRNLITLHSIGKNATWLLLQQARGMPDAKAIDDFLKEKTFLVTFEKPDLSERLCVSAAITQMSGQVVHLGEREGWKDAINRDPILMLGAISYYIDGMFVHGIPVNKWDPTIKTDFPVINCGCPDSHPAHAISTVACMLRLGGSDLRGKKICWVGAPRGPLYSLITCTVFFPFELTICMPDVDAKADVMAAAHEAGTEISFVDSPREALKGAQFIIGGSSYGMNFSQLQEYELTPHLLSFAHENPYLLLGTTPVDAIPLSDRAFKNRLNTLLMQAEFRLRVYKRMIHWVFEV